MHVKKRDGSLELMHFDKIATRIQILCEQMLPTLDAVDPAMICQRVVGQICDGITTVQIDELAAQISASMTITHPDFDTLAVRIVISSLHKQTPSTFSEAMELLYGYHRSNGEWAPRISEELITLVRAHADHFNQLILPELDYEFDYLGYSTIKEKYLMYLVEETGHRPIERPGYMYLRIAIGIHGNDMANIETTYRELAHHRISHATPTMYQAGTPRPQLASCFLSPMKADSIDGIYSTLKDCALISKYAGGIGISAHNIRAKDSYIRSSGCKGTGLFPILRNFQETARYVDQGGRRKGSFAFYVELWHADWLEILIAMKQKTEESRALLDLFFSCWVPDLFMERFIRDEDWSFFCPDEAPGLMNVIGKDFEELYLRYEQTPGLVRHKMKAQDFMALINERELERGQPYFLFKDACNRKSNQKNLGTLWGSNLCTEILQFASSEEIAVCNLASVNLGTVVDVEKGEVDLQLVAELTRILTRNLNKIIDRGFYPVPEAEYSNKRHRPIGIGVSGLADLFAKLHLPFENERSRHINRDIFESMYYGALDESCRLAEETGLTYDSYVGSPIESEGLLQFDLWKQEDILKGRASDGIFTEPPSDRLFPWTQLRERIRKFGLRNSLLLAPMPTASTASILGSSECFEPFTSNMMVRKVLSGNYIVVNKHLVRDLQALGLWNSAISTKIIEEKGSIQNIAEIPQSLKEIHKTTWEISVKWLIQLAADRGRYICQSQSMNLYLRPELATTKVLSAALVLGYKLGLKTGSYYVRTQPKQDAIQFTIDKGIAQSSIPPTLENNVPLVCDSCGV